MYQNLTSGEFQNQFEIFISSCNTGIETSFQSMIYATTGFRLCRQKEFAWLLCLNIICYYQLQEQCALTLLIHCSRD